VTNKKKTKKKKKRNPTVATPRDDTTKPENPGVGLHVFCGLIYPYIASHTDRRREEMLQGVIVAIYVVMRSTSKVGESPKHTHTCKTPGPHSWQRKWRPKETRNPRLRAASLRESSVASLSLALADDDMWDGWCRAAPEYAARTRAG